MKKICNLTNRFIAHRGLHADVPENSIISFIKALNKGYSIELDIHITKDDKIVVFHDFTLKRVCNIDKIIEECTYDELLKYNLFNTKYKIPLLNEVLNIIDGKTFLLIETKLIKFDGRLESNLSKILDNYKGSFAIHSFNIFSINWFKKNRPNYNIGLIYSNLVKYNLSCINFIKSFLFNYLKVDFISYNVKYIDTNYVKKIRKKKKIFSWTIDELSEYNKALMYSDYIIFDKLF